MTGCVNRIEVQEKWTDGLVRWRYKEVNGRIDVWTQARSNNIKYMNSPTSFTNQLANPGNIRKIGASRLIDSHTPQSKANSPPSGRVSV